MWTGLNGQMVKCKLPTSNSKWTYTASRLVFL